MSTSFFKDKHGKFVIAQSPNLPIMSWLIIVVLNFFIHSAILGWLADAFLLVWAFLELYRGVNGFRRLLGLVVLVALIMGRITHL